jgi:2Fe-2S ferredoxin
MPTAHPPCEPDQREASLAERPMNSIVEISPETAVADADTPFLRVEDRDGAIHILEAVEGWRLMEILRDHGIGMENTCGGALACAECHVVLDPGSARRVPPPREDELEKLDDLPLLYENSRLCCQIIWSDDLSGISLKIAQET